MHTKNSALIYYFLCFIVATHVWPFSNKPVCVIYTQNSILNEKNNYKPLFVGERMRYGTCSSAAWFHDNYLAILNLYGEHITTHFYDKKTNTCTQLQTINNTFGAKLRRPESICAHPNGRLLVVSNDNNPINFYSIDPITHYIQPKPVYTLPAPGDLVHNVKFSPNGLFFAYASFDKQKSICIYRITLIKDEVHCNIAYTKTNTFPLLKAKAISFTQDNAYIAIAYALGLSSSISNPYKNVLIVHHFNQDGTIGDIVSRVEGNFSTEDIIFIDNDRTIMLSDQGHDTLNFYPFDPQTGHIDSHYTLVKNPDAQLSFPHGIAVSEDQKYVAVTNYGDDKCNIYTINNT